MSCVSESCAAPAGSRPHVVTPELAALANRHLAEAHAALLRARALARAIESLDALREEAYRINRVSVRHAADLLMGPPDLRAGDSY